MTTASKRSFEISTYTNPCSDNIEDNLDLYDILLPFLAQEEKARVEGGVEHFFQDPDDDIGKHLPFGEALQANYHSRLTAESPQITQWHNIITSWMPEEAQKWWLEQFDDHNKHLDSMSKYWWQLRTRNFIFAHEKGNIDHPLGAVALTKVYSYERPHIPELNKRALFYEIRGVVVDESRRREKIGQALVVAALRAAVESGESLPTFAITTNKAAAAMFEAVGGKKEASKDYPHGGGPLYKRLVCWDSFEEGPLPCNACPKHHDTVSWWKTHLNSIDELEIPDPCLHPETKVTSLTQE
jgi:GNAT superfamily N-acetyltransferase